MSRYLSSSDANMYARVMNTNVEELGVFFAKEDNVAAAIDAVGKLG